MARIRSIKPEFTQSESMGNVSRDARLVFILLWTLADDAGRLRGSAGMLASMLLPYDVDAPAGMPGWLAELEREECIRRYQDGGAQYLQIQQWDLHQKIDRPSPSKIPKSEKRVSEASDLARHTCGNGQAESAKALAQTGRWTEDARPPALGLAPQSLLAVTESRAACRTEVAMEITSTPEQAACHATWRAYREAYVRRYGTAPVRNVRVNSQILNFVRRLGHAAAPSVAGFFVLHDSPVYLRGAHAVGIMLGDAEKLHTEWATGRPLSHSGFPLQRQTRENTRAIASTTRLADFVDDQGTPRKAFGDNDAKSLRIASFLD